MHDLFVIPIMDIDPDWSLRGFHHDRYASEYCKKVLQIPLEHIKNANLSTNGLEVSLKYCEALQKETWFIELKRIASYAPFA